MLMFKNIKKFGRSHGWTLIVYVVELGVKMGGMCYKNEYSSETIDKIIPQEGV